MQPKTGVHINTFSLKPQTCYATLIALKQNSKTKNKLVINTLHIQVILLM